MKRTAEEERVGDIQLPIIDVGCDSEDEPGLLAPLPDMLVNDNNLLQQGGKDEILEVNLETTQSYSRDDNVLTSFRR